ncbi:hypothetical protein BY996DRAFT_6530210 [Phakopsora pachyrhizi]|uniref:Uncharacterized protein n=1 Tax=Phakopsora pachyrhizi TaxID=170000 RepID=A0AAV0AVW4_PHAPC|nr:hypothetical protein BY996DRAFT_6530210 [Phakopsora pachyrhizi]CAH7674188.1 hypothetical protein PPACK8108_LOCUS9097 [Phakopsora pachyrhizi]
MRDNKEELQEIDWVQRQEQLAGEVEEGEYIGSQREENLDDEQSVDTTQAARLVPKGGCNDPELNHISKILTRPLDWIICYTYNRLVKTTENKENQCWSKAQTNKGTIERGVSKKDALKADQQKTTISNS